MKQLPLNQKSAMLHCAFQIIASADGNIDEERDAEAIELLLNSLGFSSIHAWDAACTLNPHDCFFHISTLSEADKGNFKELMFSISNLGGKTDIRKICAYSVFELCNIA